MVTNRLVEVHHHLLVAHFVVVEQVGLVKHQHNWYAIGLGRGQKAVDKGCGSLGPVNGYDEQSLVDVRSKDVTLL